LKNGLQLSSLFSSKFTNKLNYNNFKKIIVGQDKTTSKKTQKHKKAIALAKV